MTTRRANRPDDALRSAALAWYDLLQDKAGQEKTGGTDHWLALTAWLEADPANALAYSHVEDLHTDIDEGARQILLLLPPDPGPALSTARARPGRWAWLAGAAVAGGISLAVILVRPPAPLRETQTAYEAAPGHIRTVMLTDGSRVDLSPGSQVSIHFDRLSRHITLDRGEAVFTIGHDARTLTLRAADLLVQDLGTVFDVALRTSRVTVTVVSGLVAVSSGGQAIPVTLAAGQQLEHVAGSVPDRVPDRVIAADPQAVISWRSGFQTYRDVAVSDIVADLDRDFTAHVSVSDAATGARRFSGVLKIDTMEATLNRLAALLGLSVVHHGDSVELAGPGSHP